MEMIEIDDAFLYDLDCLATSGRKLHAQLRDLRVVVRSADKRWAKATDVLNKEAAKRQERNKFIKEAEDTFREFKTALYSVTDGRRMEIDFSKHVEKWTKEGMA